MGKSPKPPKPAKPAKPLTVIKNWIKNLFS